MQKTEKISKISFPVTVTFSSDFLDLIEEVIKSTKHRRKQDLIRRATEDYVFKVIREKEAV